MKSWLESVGGPVDPEQIGVSRELAEEALENAHYVRNRLTVLRLLKWAGVNF